MPNTQGIRNTPWQSFLTTVDAIEQATGYDLYSNLPPAVQACVEAGTNGVNPPGTADQSASTQEYTPVTITLQALRSNSNTLAFSVVNGPTHGSLGSMGATSCTVGSCTATVSYTPGPNYNGPDSFTFRASDGGINSNTSTVSITVTKATATINVSGYTGVYDGNAHGATGSATGVNGEDLTSLLNFGATFTDVSGGTAHWTFAGNENYLPSSGDATITITKAPSTTTVTCPASQTYTGSAIEPCTASYSGAGGLSGSLTPVYANNINAGSATAGATFGGDANHDGSTGNGGFTIIKAATTTTVICTASQTYTGSAIEPCTASYSGAGGLSGSLTPIYANNINAGSATASASYGGDANHDGSTGNGGFEITRASSSTTVNCPASATYTGSAIEPCTASYSGAGGLSGSLTPTYANNTDAGTASATATYGGDANHDGSTGNATFEITQASSSTTVTCTGSPVYNGSPITPCSVTVTGANLSLTPAPVYANNVNAGTNTASAGYTFPGDTNHTGSSDSKNFSIAKADATVNVSGFSGAYDGSPHGASGTATGVNAENLSSLLNLGASFTNVPGGTAHWTFNAGNSNGNYNSTSGDATITITKAAPVITWNNPADIVYGTALSSTQLNATANVAGNFNYTPASGTVLNAGSGQSLLSSFTPTDSTNYNAGSKTVMINVLKATAAFSNLSSPTIAYGMATTNLSGKLSFGSLIPTGNVAITLNSVTQNAAIEAGGNFASSFATGSLAPGSYSIAYNYAGDSNFNSASGSGTLQVGYGIVTLYDQTKVHQSGSTIPIKLKITDANGNNLSSAGTVVTAVGISLVSTSVYGPVEDSGNANPDNNFRFTTDSYTYNLKTTGLATGIYNLYFTVGSDPTLHTVQFQIK
jgi:hypothetical protein